MVDLPVLLFCCRISCCLNLYILFVLFIVPLFVSYLKLIFSKISSDFNTTCLVEKPLMLML